MAANPIGVQAGGDIFTCRIVIMQGTSNAFQVIQATGTSTQMFGVADEATYLPPNILGDAGKAAVNGFSFRVFQDGEEANVEIGSPVNAGDLVTSDANGRGVTASAGNYTVGQALEQGTASLQRIRVRIEPTKA